MELNSFHHQSLDARPWQDGRWVGVVSALTRVLQHIDQVYATRRRSFLIRRHQTASLSNSCAVSRWVATAASGSRHRRRTDGWTDREIDATDIRDLAAKCARICIRSSASDRFMGHKTRAWIYWRTFSRLLQRDTHNNKFILSFYRQREYDNIYSPTGCWEIVLINKTCV